MALGIALGAAGLACLPTTAGPGDLLEDGAQERDAVDQDVVSAPDALSEQRAEERRAGPRAVAPAPSAFSEKNAGGGHTLPRRRTSAPAALSGRQARERHVNHRHVAAAPIALRQQRAWERRTIQRAGAPARHQRIVRVAMKQLGAPYVWGGADPAGFDCSGLITYSFAKVGISIPHNVAQQYTYGRPVARDELKPGDLVFFDRLRHNGIYIGRGHIVHANRRGGGVTVARLDDPWFRTRWVGARRLSGEVAALSAGRSPSGGPTSQ